jgi:hypothetical protein
VAVSAPSRTTGEVDLPVPDHGTVVVDGHRAWKGGGRDTGVAWDPSSRRIVVTDLAAGDHVIMWSA